MHLNTKHIYVILTANFEILKEEIEKMLFVTFLKDALHNEAKLKLFSLFVFKKN